MHSVQWRAAWSSGLVDETGQGAEGLCLRCRLPEFEAHFLMWKVYFQNCQVVRSVWRRAAWFSGWVDEAGSRGQGAEGLCLHCQQPEFEG